ncbi:MAG: helix-turn-helix transcriptional regulator, partial [bacterium]
FIEVSRHLERIIRMSRAVADVRDRSELAALDRFGRAAMLVDWEGHVTHMNSVAENLMSRDFRLCQGRLLAADPRSQDQIDGLLHAIQTSPPGTFLHAPMALVGREGQAWLTIDVLPMTGRNNEKCGSARAILVISDLTENKAGTEADVQSLFGLTPAEARLAVALCQGKTVSQIALAFGVETSTLRSHLKNIFAKTGTGRQAELVAVLARI